MSNHKFSLELKRVYSGFDIILMRNNARHEYLITTLTKEEIDELFNQYDKLISTEEQP